MIFGVVRPAEAMPEGRFYRNGVADEMLFVHEGTGVCDTVFGPLRYGPGDYLVLPIGTTWRLEPDAGSEQRMLYLEAPSEIEPPKRYRNDYGQLLEHSPYSQRDLHAPDEVGPRDEAGDFVIDVRSADRITAYHYRHHPFDVVGWDGYLWPFRFNIGDFQPITGRVHQPPPVHQTFQARNFVVCSFVPRKFDYHPLAIPAPYNHSNINSDEVIYYVAGNFMSRRGVEIASFTLHPAGIPHGPHPGTVEASIGKEATEELAVMVDTFHPLRDHEGGDGPRRRPLPVLVAAVGGPRKGSLRARGARPGGVPRLTESGVGQDGCRRFGAGAGPRAEDASSRSHVCDQPRRSRRTVTTARVGLRVARSATNVDPVVDQEERPGCRSANRYDAGRAWPSMVAAAVLAVARGMVAGASVLAIVQRGNTPDSHASTVIPGSWRRTRQSSGRPR